MPETAALRDELSRRGAILEAVRLAATRFLDPSVEWEEALPDVLANLARATGTSRVYVFENYREDPDGEVWTTQRFEWSAPGVRSIADEPQLAAMPMIGIGFGRWIGLFRRGEPMFGLRRELPSEEQVQLAVDDTLSIACVPIIVDGVWWGFVGFDECAYERVWTAGEIDGLQAAASTISAAIRASAADDERAAMRALLEQRVQALSSMAATLALDQPLQTTLDALCAAVVQASCAQHAQVWLGTSPAQPAGSSGAPQAPEGSPAAEDVVIDLPLEDDDEAKGFLRVHCPVEGERDRAEQAFLRAAAHQAATAVRNADRLAAAQGAAALQERQRLARDLHDSVSQALYGIALGARTARQLVQDDTSRLVEPLDYVLGLADAGLAEMRALILELRPEALAEEGLVAAIDRQVRAIRGRHGLDVTADLGLEPRCEPAVKEALYRIAQEALHNIVKHAEATQVTVSLRTDDGAVVLRISDDGRGFDAGASFPGHLGLVSMAERAEGVGGGLQVTSAPGTGTHLTVTMPPH